MRPIRVLVVEDFEPFRRFICSLLEGSEFHVTEVSDGAEAVEKAEELRPDLILLDIGLPSLNGIEVARRVLELNLPSKIVFLTQERSPDVVRATLSLGAVGYVLKTRTQRDLLTAIEAVLAGRRFVSNGLL